MNDNTYVFKLLLYVDIFFSGVFFRDTGITISARTGLELRKPSPARWAVVLGWCLNHLQRDHTSLAIVHDRERAHAALEMLGNR